jgi:hypothetical protein
MNFIKSLCLAVFPVFLRAKKEAIQHEVIRTQTLSDTNEIHGNATGDLSSQSLFVCDQISCFVLSCLVVLFFVLGFYVAYVGHSHGKSVQPPNAEGHGEYMRVAK